MSKSKFLSVFAVVVLTLSFGTALAVQARANSTTPPLDFIHLEELVPPDNIRMRCEGEVKAIQNQVGLQEKITWSVTCDDVHLRLTSTPVLVGQPHRGYAAYADLVSPRRAIYYSLWVYDEPSQAATAMSQWRKHFQTLAHDSYYVTDRPGAFSVKGEDELGLPWWGRVVHAGNHLVVVKVNGLPLPLTPEDVKYWQRRDQHLETTAR